MLVLCFVLAEVDEFEHQHKGCLPVVIAVSHVYALCYIVPGARTLATVSQFLYFLSLRSLAASHPRGHFCHTDR